MIHNPPMNNPASIAILILAVSAMLGWRQSITLQQLREQEHALASKAAGVAAGKETREPGGASNLRQSRADREAEARTVTAGMIATLVEQSIHAPGEPYQKVEGRIERVLEQLYQMNALQLRMMIAELRNHPYPDGNAWYRKFLSTAITALADTDPEAAIAILAEVKGDDRWYHDGIIGKWASTDPLAALAWMRENPSKGSRQEFIIGLATKDPRLAFQALLEFKVYDLHGDGAYEGNPDFSVTQQVARSARTLEDRTAMLGILREIAGTPGDDPDKIKGLIVQNALQAMAEGIGTYGHERAITWLDSLHLRPDEIAPLMRGLRISETQAKGDTGKWFEWMGEHLSAGDFESAASQRIWEWVREDPRAAEKWLAQAADGPARRKAASDYDSFMAAQKP